jgi:hypothetical protein
MERDWPESNCYVDVWIEILHAKALEVEAMLGFTIANDYEFDQWTFFKPKPSELTRLYGLEIEELTIWRDLTAHVELHVTHGRIPLLEVDAFYLPDTEGRGYRESHTKTTIAVESIDPASECLRYLHNRAGFMLGGSDYRGLLRIDPAPSPRDLMPFCEIVKVERIDHKTTDALREIALELLQGHRARAPRSNPISRYAAAVDADLEMLLENPAETFDPYAFASIRQCGSGFALAADHLDWLGQGQPAWSEASACFRIISRRSSALVLNMARIAHSGRRRDLSGPLGEMAAAWDRGMTALDRALSQ